MQNYHLYFLLLPLTLITTSFYCMDPSQDNYILTQSGNIKNAGEIYNGQHTFHPTVSANFLISDMYQSKVLRGRDEYTPNEVSVLDFSTGICTNFLLPLDTITEANPIAALELLTDNSFAVGHKKIVYTFSHSDLLSTFADHFDPQRYDSSNGQVTLLSQFDPFQLCNTSDDEIYAIQQTSKYLVVVSKKGFIMRYNKNGDNIDITTLKATHCNQQFFSLSVDKEHDIICFGLNNGKIQIFNINKLREMQTVQIIADCNRPITSISCADGNILAAALCNCSGRLAPTHTCNYCTAITSLQKQHTCKNIYAFACTKELLNANNDNIHFFGIPSTNYPQEMLLLSDKKCILRTYCASSSNKYRAQENVLLIDLANTSNNNSQLLNRYDDISPEGLEFLRENPLRVKIEKHQISIFHEKNFACAFFGFSSFYTIFTARDKLTFNQQWNLFLEKYSNHMLFLFLAIPTPLLLMFLVDWIQRKY